MLQWGHIQVHIYVAISLHPPVFPNILSADPTFIPVKIHHLLHTPDLSFIPNEFLVYLLQLRLLLLDFFLYPLDGPEIFHGFHVQFYQWDDKEDEASIKSTIMCVPAVASSSTTMRAQGCIWRADSVH